MSSGIVVRRAALLSRPFLPLEQVGQVHLENLLRPLEAFEKVGPERLSMSGNKHSLAFNNAPATVDVTLVQCGHATFSRLEAGSSAPRRAVAVRER